MDILFSILRLVHVISVPICMGHTSPHSYMDPISLTEFPLECVPVVGKLLCGIVTDEKVLHVECAIR